MMSKLLICLVAIFASASSCNKKTKRSNSEAKKSSLINNKNYNPEAKKSNPINNKNYNLETALELMLLNDFLYATESQKASDYNKIKQTVETKIQKDEKTKKYELIWLGVSGKNENLTCVTRLTSSSSKVLCVVTRGTVLSFLDIKEDIDVKLINWNDKVSPNIKISEGVRIGLDTVNRLTSQVFGKENLSTERITLMNLLKNEMQGSNETTVYVTGHSLGGVLTTGLALMIAEEFQSFLDQKKLKLVAYNFAGQTVGNKAFKEYYDSFLANKNISFSHYRVVNPYDVVPFTFGDLEGIKKIGYPYTKDALIEVQNVINGLEKSLSLSDKNFMHVGADPIKLKAKLPPPGCDTEVKNLIVFSCWAIYEHQSFYYVDLLKAGK